MTATKEILKMPANDRGSCGILLLFLSVLLLSGCAPSTIGYSSAPTASAAPRVLTEADTMQLENSDRINRFRRLSHLDRIVPPIIEQVNAPAGVLPNVPGPVPVVRVVFDEGVFFNTDSAIPLPQATPVLDLIAQNMRLDVPDAALTILGHTDSTGSDSYNMRLSERRALYVMRLLVDRGLDPLQMTTVAIGDRQPIAPNDTPQGRARNRRVEFLISASPEANLAVIQRRKVNPNFFSTGRHYVAPPPSQRSVHVLQGRRLRWHGTEKVAFVPVGPMQLAQPSSENIRTQKLAPPPMVSMRPAQTISPANLSDIVVN